MACWNPSDAHSQVSLSLFIEIRDEKKGKEKKKRKGEEGKIKKEGRGREQKNFGGAPIEKVS